MWYLMAVLVFEIWLDYRREIVLLSQSSKGLLRLVYKVMTLGSSKSVSARWPSTSGGLDRDAGRHSSAFLLHGYVGFIFGSLKANPWCRRR